MNPFSQFASKSDWRASFWTFGLKFYLTPWSIWNLRGPDGFMSNPVAKAVRIAVSICHFGFLAFLVYMFVATLDESAIVPVVIGIAIACNLTLIVVRTQAYYIRFTKGLG